jgi:hypothetical protein
LQTSSRDYLRPARHGEYPLLLPRRPERSKCSYQTIGYGLGWLASGSWLRSGRQRRRTQICRFPFNQSSLLCLLIQTIIIPALARHPFGAKLDKSQETRDQRAFANAAPSDRDAVALAWLARLDDRLHRAARMTNKPNGVTVALPVPASTVQAPSEARTAQAARMAGGGESR